ncbi:MAG TPA: YeeE/YedE thiosulfate transporter family protein [Opitutaceae bacterium]|nr:YeeE/YedE thiosulfate transporter family protein [Opitutaceae bacterium]
MLPLDINAELGRAGGNAVFFLIGAAFGATLELAGFGDSRRLAAQFYLKDMTVLKTMFTGIVVACLLLFLSSALGLLDFSQIAVNQTFLWPGIVGGLIMGIGFIVGGYCPGTSVVSAASLKLDGLLFLVGTGLGAGLFGETVSSFSEFWNSSFTDRLLVSDWLGWSIGATVFAVTLMALGMFYAAEKTEEFFRSGTFSWKIARPVYLAGAGALFAVAAAVWIIGQPDPLRRWELLQGRYAALLASRAVFIDPLEYLKTANDTGIKLLTLDLRAETEFTVFHLAGSERRTLDELLDSRVAAPLAQLPAQGVVVLVADDEAVAVAAWQRLKVQGVSNLYILEGGLSQWHARFAGRTLHGKPFDLSRPPASVLELFPKDAFTPKIKLATKKRSGGLCS